MKLTADPVHEEQSFLILGVTKTGRGAALVFALHCANSNARTPAANSASALSSPFGSSATLYYTGSSTFVVGAGFGTLNAR